MYAILPLIVDTPPPPQRAIDYARSHYAVVYFPLGMYRVTDTLRVQQAQRAMSTGYKPGGVCACDFSLKMCVLCVCVCLPFHVCMRLRMFAWSSMSAFIDVQYAHPCMVATHVLYCRSVAQGRHARLPIGRRVVSLGAELPAGGRDPGEKLPGHLRHHS